MQSPTWLVMGLLHGNDWRWWLQRAFSGNVEEEAELYREMQAHSFRFG